MTMLDSSSFELPPIPSKRYFTIGEVSRLCAVKPYVLRYWEQEFSQLKPVKRSGNRRYYQRHEIKLIRQIKHLLYVDGFTINGTNNRLQKMAEQNLSSSDVEQNQNSTMLIKQIIVELNEVYDILR